MAMSRNAVIKDYKARINSLQEEDRKYRMCYYFTGNKYYQDRCYELSKKIIDLEMELDDFKELTKKKKGN